MKNKAFVVLTGLMIMLMMSGIVSAACSSRTASTSMKNSFGVKVLTYYQKVNWCYDGKKILSKSASAWGQVVIPVNLPGTWTYDKVVAKSEVGGVGASSYKLWTKGHFALNIMGMIIQDRYPWVEQTVTATGGYSYRAGE